MSGTVIRFPSTANLFVASSDRTSGSSSRFQISKQQNIMSGFFTRMAVTEMVMRWSIPNIDITNSLFIVNIAGASAATLIVQFDTGFYTVQSLLNELALKLNAASLLQPPASIFSIGGLAGNKYLECNNTFTIADTPLARQLSLQVQAPSPVGIYQVLSPNLLKYEYIDFLCSQLTYQANLKDGSTGRVDRDSLYRWVFAWEDQPQIDAFGYPILQGYTPFVARRYLSFPKQITWNGDQPLGQMQFEVVDSNGIPIITDFPNNILSTTLSSQMDFNMCLLVSEQ